MRVLGYTASSMLCFAVGIAFVFVKDVEFSRKVAENLHVIVLIGFGGVFADIAYRASKENESS